MRIVPPLRGVCASAWPASSSANEKNASARRFIIKSPQTAVPPLARYVRARACGSRCPRTSRGGIQSPERHDAQAIVGSRPVHLSQGIATVHTFYPLRDYVSGNHGIEAGIGAEMLLIG